MEENEVARVLVLAQGVVCVPVALAMQQTGDTGLCRIAAHHLLQKRLTA